MAKKRRDLIMNLVKEYTSEGLADKSFSFERCNAFDIALDSKAATWPYIRKILQDKQSRGVRCLADWDALEKKRESGKNSSAESVNKSAWGYVK